MAKKHHEFQSPGQALKTFLSEKDWTQEDLSYILSISLKHTNEIIKDKKPISLELAKLLENVFDLRAIEWMQLVAKHQLLDKSGDARGKDVRLKADIYKYMPINELIKKGWLKKTDDLDKELKSFWGLSKKQNIDLSFLENRKIQLEYKKSDAYSDTFNEFNALIWHRMAINFSNHIKVKEYNRSGLHQLMTQMHAYTTISNGIEEFLIKLKEVGVKFIFLSHLSKTYLDGAAFQVEKNPVVVLTGRYDRVDNFWFTLAHELSHVYLHLVNGDHDKIFIDDTTKSQDITSEKEFEANQKAEEMLLNDRIQKHFVENINYITDDKVMEFSIKNNIHSSIVVGMLAFNGLVSYSTLHRFKEPVKDKIPYKYRAD